MRWTAKDCDHLIRMKRQHESWQRIADRLGVSVGAAKMKYQDLRAGLSRRPPPNPGATFAPTFEIPPKRRNDDAKHLRLILEALRREHAA